MDPKKIAVALKKIGDKNNPEYELTITSLMKNEGRYFGYINVGTDSKINPAIKIYVSVYIRKKPSTPSKGASG